MNEILEQIICSQNDDKIIEMIYKSDVDLTNSLEDIINLLGSYCIYNRAIIEKYGINVDDMINCLGNFDMDNADTLLKICGMLHKNKRETVRLIENGVSGQDLKTLGRICAIADKNCYQILKQKYGIVRTLSNSNDETVFCKY